MKLDIHDDAVKNDVRVLVDGQDVTRGLTNYRLERGIVGPAELTLTANVLDIRVQGDVDVRVLIGSESFTGEQLRVALSYAIRSGDTLAVDAALRLLKALPLTSPAAPPNAGTQP